MKLEPSAKEHDRTLLIVMDERLHGLNGTLTYYAYGKGVSVPGFTSDSTMEQTYNLKKAQLLVVDNHLRIVYREQLDVTTARVDKVFLYGDANKPTFVLTKDYSQGSGSYNGPVSFFGDR
ncbi:hypothetical protein QNI16_19925 [Cytophagaceae bacterium YF14B1]|uniref:Uncharacterized protein n=1 Tax=Xanthocytophaga flava TaxID=3048013 RepID=A0AAE3UAG9_9BACT|nr:hypothetical protein [Xanthocytophaga flavus]MDJ1482779.1 hypothetical protein [Xanthocytophaga flavus]